MSRLGKKCHLTNREFGTISIWRVLIWCIFTAPSWYINFILKVREELSVSFCLYSVTFILNNPIFIYIDTGINAVFLHGFHWSDRIREFFQLFFCNITAPITILWSSGLILYHHHYYYYHLSGWGHCLILNHQLPYYLDLSFLLELKRSVSLSSDFLT